MPRAGKLSLLDAHVPYPGIAIDRQWNVLMAKSAAGLLSAGLPVALSGPPLNVYRACLHPDGLARQTVNFDEWAGYLLAQLRRSIALTADPGLRAIAEEVSGRGRHRRPSDRGGKEPALLVPLRLWTGEGELSLFTTLTTFGTPYDVTVDELAVELYFPADEATDALLSTHAPTESMRALGRRQPSRMANSVELARRSSERAQSVAAPLGSGHSVVHEELVGDQSGQVRSCRPEGSAREGVACPRSQTPRRSIPWR